MTESMSKQDVKFLNHNPPEIPELEARQVAFDLFGLSGDFKSLNSERDQNYRIKTDDGSCYVLKIANVDEDIDVIDFQIRAQQHIEQVDPTIPIPRVLKNKNGRFSDIFESSTGTRHIVYALTYMQGDTLETVSEPSPRMWKRLGAIMARIDFALRSFFHPKARHEIIWDTMSCLDLRQHVCHIADVVSRKNVEAIFEHMEKNVFPKLKNLRQQVIHGDAFFNNVLTDPATPDSIAGVIDFGDLVHAPVVIEVANSIDLLHIDPKGYMSALCSFTVGFDNVYPLEENEIDLVYDLILARYAAFLTIIAWRREVCSDQPDYEPESEALCGTVISNLMEIGREQVTATLRDACRFPPYCPIDNHNNVPDDTDAMLKRRHDVLGTELHLFYARPVHVERGRGPWLYDIQGRAYLDCYNNVPVVGHCHPHVVKAISRQVAALNTNTRYLYRNILDYAERITSGMPDKLSVCVFVNSGSEANDIALRMARFVTGQRGAIVMHNAYHGITESIADLSPYGVKEKDLAPHVRTLMSPDPYRGIYKHGEPGLAESYAADTDRAIDGLTKKGFNLSACMIDTAYISNGIPDFPDGYLAAVTKKIHAAGGLMIADEVQAGFGRPGTHMWGFMAQGVVPDFVTMGKPVGNGYPLGIIVTSPEILNAFVKKTDLFSTFGGNPVACAAGMAVLDVIENEELMANARETGEYLRQGIRSLMSQHTIIGDVRGRGMLAGVELVRNHETLEAADTEVDRMVDLLKENGVLVGSEGPLGNILKIRPPMIFKPEHADILVEALDRSLKML
ncbi:MAG: aminotransferase class III-fold pyridoxal phosphate-dependent enzyme [Desulfobacterales bacterium]|nr:aminotransferase class III-fold pyridoxal phosphate-dependent enzyme [Desulfobacterales bacterium]